MSKSFTKTISLEIEVEIEGDYTAGTPDVPYLRNGDPGYPGEPASFSITKVMWGEIDITKNLEKEEFDFSSLEEECLEEVEDDEPDYDEDFDDED